MTGWFRCGRGNEVRGSGSEGGEPLTSNPEPEKNICCESEYYLLQKNVYISHVAGLVSGCFHCSKSRGRNPDLPR